MNFKQLLVALAVGALVLVLALTVSGASTPTDISVVTFADRVEIESSTGADDFITAATADRAGVMTAADKAKLDSLVAGGGTPAAPTVRRYYIASKAPDAGDNDGAVTQTDFTAADFTGTFGDTATTSSNVVVMTLTYFNGPDTCPVSGGGEGCRVVGVAVPAGTAKWTSVRTGLGGDFTGLVGLEGHTFPDDASQTGVAIDGATYDVYGAQNWTSRPPSLLRGHDLAVELTFE